jgi:hypothetical protein
VNPKNILTELKRRNVYRAAVAYGVVAWFFTQLTTQVFPFFENPNSAVRFVVIALAVGFPIAMLLSWLYEFTPEGIVRTEDLHPAQARSIQRATGRILDFIIIGVLLLVIAMLIVGGRPFYRQSGETISQKSIAVLPFENLSEDKANAYFAEGIQDEILTRLSKIADLKVRAADADSPRRSGDYCHDKDDDDGRLFALHARRFYTDRRIRHANSSAERIPPRPSCVRKDVKGDCVQSGMGRFVGSSWKILRIGTTRSTTVLG